MGSQSTFARGSHQAILENVSYPVFGPWWLGRRQLGVGSPRPAVRRGVVLDSDLVTRQPARDVQPVGRAPARAVIDTRLKVLVGTGLLAGVAAIALTLSGSPIAVARVNTTEDTVVEVVRQRLSACQANEALPRGTSAIRLRTFAFLGPRVTVQVLAHGRVIARGERESGWTGGVVTVPVNRLATARTGVETCFTLFPNGDETIELVGEPTTGPLAARSQEGPLPGRIRVEYLRPGSSSWWSLAPEVARRMGLGHAPAGTWSVLLVIALMGSLVALCSRLILRELG